MPVAEVAALVTAGLEPEPVRDPWLGRVPGVLGPALAQWDLLGPVPVGLLRITP